MCTSNAQCATTRTTCFIPLLWTVLYEHLVEIGRRRQCGARDAFADDNRACLPGIRSVFLVRFNSDAVGTLRHGIAVVVQAIPHQLIFPRRPRRACDGAELARLSMHEVPYR